MALNRPEPIRISDKTELLDYLMRRFGAAVLKLAYYHVRDRHLAEDILQEVFFRIYEKMESFRKDSSYYTWIYRITVNLCKDVKKSAYYRRVLPWNGRTASPDEAHLFEEAEGGDVFARVMDLPEKYRVVIALFYFEDMQTPEIASVLRVSEENVRTRLHRARGMLKELLGGPSNE